MLIVSQIPNAALRVKPQVKRKRIETATTLPAGLWKRKESFGPVGLGRLRPQLSPKQRVRTKNRNPQKEKEKNRFSPPCLSQTKTLIKNPKTTATQQWPVKQRWGGRRARRLFCRRSFRRRYLTTKSKSLTRTYSSSNTIANTLSDFPASTPNLSPSPYTHILSLSL